MTIEKNAYLQALENKICYDRTFKALELNEDNPYQRFFRNNNIEINGKEVQFIITWPKEGLDWRPDLSIHNDASGFRRDLNVAVFRLPRLIDKVNYEITNPERFLEALENESACKDFTNNLIEQTAEEIELVLEERVPELICQDDNFIKYNATTKKGNLYEEEDTEDAPTFSDPLWIHEQLFNGSSILKKRSRNFNKGYLKDPEDKSKGYEPLETKVRSYKKMVVLLDSTVRNKTIIGGYKENVNYLAMDLEKRFGTENVLEDNLPNGYKMILMDERCLQLYKKASKKGFRHKEEAENGNEWFFLNPIIHGGFITAFNCLAWKQV